ncbi:MAG: nickel pincer cofactor biosynthesis protein LarC [Archaeoglobaceae archaeon]|nr:nickel pincer cofactor biosynthesis protein LarC [Archaeoglobaceae archaeon]MDW8118783.1 nickel pincer cofactor biosynthesis protein LarC [Archaeoglobaceae archaeon]
MRVAIFDAFNGASGDMIISSLLNLALTEEDLKEIRDVLQLKIKFRVEEVKKKGISANRVIVEEFRAERSFSEVVKLIENSKLEQDIKEDSKRIFERMAIAEGKIHGRDYKKAIFHEVGSDDAIFDVVCSVKGIRRLLSEGYRFFATPLRLGGGFVETSHGKYPVPVPAVLEILKNSKLEVVFGGEKELLTPTASAILAHYCEGTFKFPMRVEKISYGAGSFETEVPNVLRLILGFSELSDSIAIVETLVDDLSGEEIGYALERLRTENLDVTAIPVMAKKSRPAIKIEVLTKLENAEETAIQLMKETGSLGARIIPIYHRMIADRSLEEREVRIGEKSFKVRFKISKALGTAKPEFEDVARIANELRMPIYRIYKILEGSNADLERQ